jgi:serine/threonine-protein kinase
VSGDGSGSEFGGYRIERVIGRGGMSVVYLAEHLRLRRKVALKVLFRHLAEEPGFRDRFIRESRTAATLDHPNVVTVYDAGEVDGQLYLSMRYVEGTDLKQALERGALEPWRAISIVSQVASALDAAHAEGLVHRDVKPANILLSRPDTPIERAFLSDFGITKRIDTEEALTRTGQFVGTVDYVAPEQIRAGAIDGRTDVYSLGCVLYQCLSGVAPFPRPTDVATIYAHLNDEPPTVSLGVPGMAPVIAKALAKEKEDRYPTCQALAEAARSQLQAGDVTEVVRFPGTARLDEPGHDVEPMARRRGRAPLVVTFAIAAIVAVSLTVAIARDGTPRAGGSPSAAPTRTSPTRASSAEEPGRRLDPASINWVLRTWSGGGDDGQVAITSAALADGDKVVAAGHADVGPIEDAAVWIRRANDTWGSRSLPGGADAVDFERIWDLVAKGDRIVAVGYDGDDPAAWYSTDAGDSWERADVPLPSDGGAQAMRTVVVAPDGTFVALGTDDGPASRTGAAWTSGDGSEWTRLAAPALEGSTAGQPLGAETVGDSIFAVGSVIGPDGSLDVAVWGFRDGTWTREDPDVFSLAGDQRLLDVAALGDTVVAVGAEGPDEDLTPQVWTMVGGGWLEAEVPPTPSAAEITSVVPVGDRFLLAGGSATSSSGDADAAIWFSRDGLEWKRQPPASDDVLNLGGRRHQWIRALVPNDEEDRIFALGEEAKEVEPDGTHTGSHARVWIGTFYT